MSTTSSEVLHHQEGALGIITLNRPKALNALNTGMVESLYSVLQSFEATPSVAAVVIDGAGGKAFCAGGDVKAVVQMGQAGEIEEAMRFFRSEYRTNYKIATYSKPYIALLDGITMGGGAGVSVHGPYRIATENTLFAMPECAIGLIPDIGGSYFLSRLPSEVGLYLGLSGARLKGVDVLHAGLATHYIQSSLLPDLHAQMLSLGPSVGDHQKLRMLLNEFQNKHSLPQGDLVGKMGTIKDIFGGRESVEEIYPACEKHGDFGTETVELMSKGSPTSQRIVLEQLRRGATMPLDECLRMEYRLVHHLVAKQGSDFHSGVEAVLITRSGAPKWHPSRLADVPREAVLELFEALPPNEELQLDVVAGVGKPKL